MFVGEVFLDGLNDVWQGPKHVKHRLEHEALHTDVVHGTSGDVVVQHVVDAIELVHETPIGDRHWGLPVVSNHVQKNAVHVGVSSPFHPVERDRLEQFDGVGQDDHAGELLCSVFFKSVRGSDFAARRKGVL